jgi:hypothetical protein
VYASLNMTDRDVVERAAAMINKWMPPIPVPARGGNPEKLVSARVQQPSRPMRKTLYTIQISGRRALLLMALLRPFMMQRRREKIDELFNLTAAADLIKFPNGRHVVA